MSTAHCCHNITNNTLIRYGLDAKGLGQTHLNLSQNLIGGTPYQSGALFSYEGNPEEVILRVGISFVSTDQACANAEEEIGTSSFEEIQKASKALWQEKLSKIEIDVVNTLPNVTEMLYSSLYRASLTPVGVNHRNEVELTVFLQNNATLETQGAFANTTSFYFDSLYCSWDTVSNNDVISEFNSPTYAVPNILPPHGSSLPSRIRTNRGQLHRCLA